MELNGVYLEPEGTYRGHFGLGRGSDVTQSLSGVMLGLGVSFKL
jgi:hypothetical protein